MLKTFYKHEQLTSLLREELRRDGFAGQRFHTVKYLKDTYQVSQATLTRALQPLFGEGLLYSIPGKGTFVQQPAGGPSLNRTGTDTIQSVLCVVSDREIFLESYNRMNWNAASGILRGLLGATQSAGKQLHITPMTQDINIFRQVAQRSESAFIFMEYAFFEPLIEYCIRRKLPYAVYVGHQPSRRALNQVWLDVEHAEYSLVRFLIERGHRNIGFLGDHERSHRFRGYRTALREARIPIDSDWARYEIYGTAARAEEQACELLMRHPELTAISCTTDARAAGARTVALKLGRDIEITGMNGDVPDAAWFSLPLEFAQIGRELHRIAMELMETGNVQIVKMAPEWNGPMACSASAERKKESDGQLAGLSSARRTFG